MSLTVRLQAYIVIRHKPPYQDEKLHGSLIQQEGLLSVFVGDLPAGFKHLGEGTPASVHFYKAESAITAPVWDTPDFVKRIDTILAWMRS